MRILTNQQHPFDRSVLTIRDAEVYVARLATVSLAAGAQWSKTIIHKPDRCLDNDARLDYCPIVSDVLDELLQLGHSFILPTQKLSLGCIDAGGIQQFLSALADPISRAPVAELVYQWLG